jgi:acetyl esterase/lipase
LGEVTWEIIANHRIIAVIILKFLIFVSHHYYAMHVYRSNRPSVAARVVRSLLWWSGMKRRMKKNIIVNTYQKKPASIPRSLRKRVRITSSHVNGRDVFTLSPEKHHPDKVIIYLHGGAYYVNITRLHWSLIEELMHRTQAVFVVPDYPLAPEATCHDTYRFMDAMYAQIIHDHPDKEIIIMGDSAGGGLSLGYAMKISSEEVQQPSQIILFSPWLDVSMTNPEIDRYKTRDPVINVSGLKIAGERYAGDLSLFDYRVSPVYGDLRGVGKVSVFAGTHEVMVADARRLVSMLADKNMGCNYYEYAGMFHDWMLVPWLNESRQLVQQVTDILQSPAVTDPA